MNWSRVFEVGIKITVTVLSGVIAYVGISNAINSNKDEEIQPDNNFSNDSSNLDLNNNFSNNPVAVGRKRKRTTGEAVVNGLRNAQDVFGKVGMTLSSATALATNLNTLFKNDPNTMVPYHNEPWYIGSPYTPYQNCNCNYNNMNMGGGWTRVSPFTVNSGNQFQC